MQPTASNSDSRPIFPCHVYNQAGFDNPFINGKGSSIVKGGYPDNFMPAYLFVYLFLDKKILRAQKHVTIEN